MNKVEQVSRGRIFGACWQTGAVLSVLALLLRSQAQSISVNVLNTDPQAMEALLYSALLATENQVSGAYRLLLSSIKVVCGGEAVAVFGNAGQPEVWHVGVAFAACVGVTSARALLLQAWPAFAETSHRSNQQVLTKRLGSHRYPRLQGWSLDLLGSRLRVCSSGLMMASSMKILGAGREYFHPGL